MASKEYWQGYIDAIRHADTHLQCIGDDRTVRNCREAVLKLAGVYYNPNHLMPIPTWPPEEYLIARCQTLQHDNT